MKQQVLMFESYCKTLESVSSKIALDISLHVEDAQNKLEEYDPGFAFADYELDSQMAPDSGRDDAHAEVWIEFKGVDRSVVEDVAHSYGKFEQHFKEWCGRKNLVYDQILTTEDSVTYVVSVYWRG